MGRHSFFDFLLRRWKLYLITGILGFALGMYYAYFSKPTYKSKLTFALDEGGGDAMSGIASIASQFGISMGEGKFIFGGDNILQIIKSRRMVERVLLSTDTINQKPIRLIDRWLDVSGIRKKNKFFKETSFPLTQDKTAFTYLQDSILNYMYLHIVEKCLYAEKPDRKLNIYEIDISSPDERLTKIFTERLVTETNLFYTELRTKKAQTTLNALESRANAMRESLSTSIIDKASVMDANINPAFATPQVPIIKRQAEMQVYGKAYEEIFKNLELARFQYLNDMPLLQIIDGADYPMKKIKMSKLFTGIIFAGLLCSILFIIQRIQFVRKINKNISA